MNTTASYTLGITPATFWQKDKTVSIDIVEIVITDPKKEKQLRREFNKITRVIEWVGGCTYYISTNHRMKSASLDELYQMFKASKMQLPVPERKCFMIEKK